MKQVTPHLRGIIIPESELQLSLRVLGGRGGGERNVSKIETKVTITFDYMAC